MDTTINIRSNQLIAGHKRRAHTAASTPMSREATLDFSPTSKIDADLGDYDNNYLIDKYKKTLKKQAIKRQKLITNDCGLLSLREALAEQLRINSELQCSVENIVMFADSRSCFDFIVRLLSGDIRTAILENPGSRKVKSAVLLNSLKYTEIAIDENGLIVEHLLDYRDHRAAVIITPTIQNPLGVSMPLERKLRLLRWSHETASVLVDRGAIHGFLKDVESPSLWQLSGGKNVIGIWEFASVLKPWSQMCCAFFPDDLLNRAKQLRSIIGGEPALNEQFAMHEFIVDGDLFKTQKHRDLLCLEKRRQLTHACNKVFHGEVRSVSMNKGSKLVFDVSADIDLEALIECARRVEIPASCLSMLSDHQRSDKLMIDLDRIAVERIAEKIEALECVLEIYRSRGDRL